LAAVGDVLHRLPPDVEDRPLVAGDRHRPRRDPGDVVRRERAREGGIGPQGRKEGPHHFLVGHRAPPSKRFQRTTSLTGLRYAGLNAVASVYATGNRPACTQCACGIPSSSAVSRSRERWPVVHALPSPRARSASMKLQIACTIDPHWLAWKKTF